MLMIDATGAVSTAAQFQAKVKPLTATGAEARHQKSVNALMADFSVKSKTWADINRGLSYGSTL